jgi:di/tricarboxylate transporter
MELGFFKLGGSAEDYYDMFKNEGGYLTNESQMSFEHTYDMGTNMEVVDYTPVIITFVICLVIGFVFEMNKRKAIKESEEIALKTGKSREITIYEKIEAVFVKILIGIGILFAMMFIRGKIQEFKNKK